MAEGPDDIDRLASLIAKFLRYSKKAAVKGFAGAQTLAHKKYDEINPFTKKINKAVDEALAKERGENSKTIKELRIQVAELQHKIAMKEKQERISEKKTFD